MAVAMIVSSLLLLGAVLLMFASLFERHRRERQVSQRLQGQMVRDNRLGTWLRAVGDSFERGHELLDLFARAPGGHVNVRPAFFSL